MSVTRYSIVSFWVQKPGEIISFQHKISAYLKRCTGFKLSLVGSMDPSLLNCEIGRISASFNSLKEEAITSALRYEETVTQDFQDLAVELHPGQIVSGVYVDAALHEEFTPYKVQLYLRCTDKEGQTQNQKGSCTTT
jgi:hypothetical protein